MLAKGSLLFFLVLWMSGCSTTSLDRAIEPDNQWHSGQLSNGLRYHFKHVEGKALSLRMRVHVGSLQEDDGQQGYAHFIEHMAFQGGRHFQRHQAVDFFAQQGVLFGEGLNASTDYHYTIYKLDLPEHYHWQSGLRWFRDIGDGLSLDHYAVEREKGIVLSEHRLKMPEPKPYSLQAYEAIIHETPFSNAHALGTHSSISNLTAASLRAFYHTWYQPQLTDITLVGDLTLEQVQASIESLFGNWRQGATPRPDFVSLERRELADFVAQITIDEAQSFSVVLLRDETTIGTFEQRYRVWQEALLRRLIAQRLESERYARDIPHVEVAVTDMALFRRKLDVVDVVFTEDDRQTASQMTMQVLAQLRDYGVSEAELQTALLFVREAIETQPMHPSDIADEWLRAHRDNQIIQSPQQRQADLDEFFRRQIQRNVNRAMNFYLSNPMMLSTSVSELANRDARLRDLAVWRSAYEMQSPMPLQVTASSDVTHPATYGEIVSSKWLADNMTLWQLGNGVEAIYIQDPSMAANVHMTMAALGGLAALPNEQLAAGNAAADVLMLSGVDKLAGAHALSFLHQRGITVTPFIQHTQHGVEIKANAYNVADALAITHHLLTSPRLDEPVLTLVKNQLSQEVVDYAETPFGQLNHAMVKNVFSEGGFYDLIAAEEYQQLTLHDIESVHQSLFTTPFKWVIQANLPQQEMASLLKRYIATIPMVSLEKVAFDLPLNDQFASYLSVKGDRPDSALVMMDFQSTQRSLYDLQTLAADQLLLQVVKQRLFNTVRNREGLDYAPNALLLSPDSGGVDLWQLYAKVTPNDAEQVEVVFGEILTSLRQGITEKELQRARAHLHTKLDNASVEDLRQQIMRYWLHFDSYAVGFKPRYLIDSITVDDLNRRANQVFGIGTKQVTTVLEAK
ncbi:M16 family metallopeptidase [Thaumasiovibrio subtropicus]|uniref:M16 family metallopeptidase n=1 Tax=Thaumasiovibrio subtropicus TaxID=1891207 RepID=UPI000B354D6E|nr:insulinase family protein [Thaumasiovibrio subtropicus]